MLEYFAPKTKFVSLMDGVGHHATSRGGTFEIPILNDNCNKFFYWVFTALRSDGSYACGLYNRHDKHAVSLKDNLISWRADGFDTEQDAANALDQFAARLAAYNLKRHLKKLTEQVESTKTALAKFQGV
jgi:hypothetical protein